MDNIATLLAAGADVLQRAGIDEPRRESSSLLEFALGRDRTFIIAHPEFDPGDEVQCRFLGFVDRRSAGEPFHYIKGSKEFYGLDFEVSPAVLIPRPETEMLVERSLHFLENHDRPRFCEVGVGSGCISIAVLANEPRATAVGLEISEAAMEVAAKNASRYSVSARFELRRSDVFGGLRASEKFDLIVSNPPYIPAADVAFLQPEVRDHEPHAALTDGSDGLSVIRRIVSVAPGHLIPGGLLAFEIGIGQLTAVEGMFASAVWSDIAVQTDLQGIPRTVAATLKS